MHLPAIGNLAQAKIGCGQRGGTNSNWGNFFPNHLKLNCGNTPCHVPGESDRGENNSARRPGTVALGSSPMCPRGKELKLRWPSLSLASPPPDQGAIKLSALVSNGPFDNGVLSDAPERFGKKPCVSPITRVPA